MMRLFLILPLITFLSCDMGIISGPTGSPPDDYPSSIRTDTTIYIIKANEVQTNPPNQRTFTEYELESSISYVYTNRTDFSVYIPLCDGIHYPPFYQKWIGGEWRENAINRITPAGPYPCPGKPYLEVAPGASYREQVELYFTEDMLNVDEVNGTYRLHVSLHSDSSFSESTLLPIQQRVSNPFEFRVQN